MIRRARLFHLIAAATRWAALYRRRSEVAALALGAACAAAPVLALGQTFHSGKQDLPQSSLGVAVGNEVLGHLPWMQAKGVVRAKFAKGFSAHIGWEIKQSIARPATVQEPRT